MLLKPQLAGKSRKKQEKVKKAGKSGKSREKQEKENSAFRGGAFVGRGVEWTPGVACPLLATTIWQTLRNISVFVFVFDHTVQRL